VVQPSPTKKGNDGPNCRPRVNKPACSSFVLSISIQLQGPTRTDVISILLWVLCVVWLGQLYLYPPCTSPYWYAYLYAFLIYKYRNVSIIYRCNPITISRNVKVFHIITHCTPCQCPPYDMSSSSRPPIYVLNRFCLLTACICEYHTTKFPQLKYMYRISHFRIVHSQQNNTLSYIILFTNVITLVFLLPHFSLKFGLKKFPQ
jgi:hypothetical protein